MSTKKEVDRKYPVGVGDSGLLADIGECSVAVVVEEVIVLASESARTAHDLTPRNWQKFETTDSVPRGRLCKS